MQKVRIFERKALSCLLGHGKLAYATESAGFDVTLWQTREDGTECPEYTRHAATYAQAKQIAKQMEKRP